MAEFSKQWAEKNDPEMPWDFDILEIADTLEPNYYSSYICEGYGFIAIAKDGNGDIMLGIPTGESNLNEDGTYVDEVNWKSFDEVII